MDVVGHELHVVAVNVVVNATGDRVQIIIRDLAWIEVLVFAYHLELFRDNEVAALDIIAFGGEVREVGHDPARRPALVTLAQVFADKFKWPPMKSRINTVSLALGCRGGGESAH